MRIYRAIYNIIYSGWEGEHDFTEVLISVQVILLPIKTNEFQ